MSEINLSALAESGKHEIDSKTPTPMQQVNDALKECGFGLFHIRILSSSLIGFVSGVLVSNSTSYLLPTAECDLKMDLVQKGLLNAMPYLGMLFSTVIAGFLTDTFGRKVFIFFGFGGIFTFTVISATSQSYNVLVTSKFFEGVLFATSFSAGITLTSEFCHHGIRDRVLLCQSSFAALSQIIIAAMSWGILTNDWHFSFFDGSFVLNTWNFYLFAVSLWSLATCLLYIFIPESPKYLITQKNYTAARKILTNIYRENHRNSKNTDPFKDLWKKEEQAISDNSGNKVESSISHQIVVSLHNIKSMFQRPLTLYLIVLSIMTFCIMALYNILRLWFPQVSTIVEHNSFTTADNVNQDLCEMLDTYTSGLKTRHENTSDVCIPTKSGRETYINSMIIGCACIIPFFVSGVLVNKIGKKCILIISSLITLATTLGLRWANSKTAVVALFSLDIAISQMMMSLNQAIVIEFFPTTTRTLALSLIMMFGRIGTLVGNITFPVMLEMACIIPFYTMASLMLCVLTLSLFIPTKKK